MCSGRVSVKVVSIEVMGSLSLLMGRILYIYISSFLGIFYMSDHRERSPLGNNDSHFRYILCYCLVVQSIMGYTRTNALAYENDCRFRGDKQPLMQLGDGTDGNKEKGP